MKKISSILLMAAVVVLSGCNKFLDRQPLDSASSATFMQTEEEMNLALNGVYAAGFWQFPNNTPLLFAIEATTDLAIKRTGNAEDQVAMGDGGPFLVGNSLPGTAWNQAYKLITRANIMLDGMTKGQGNVSAARYARLRAEALVLRAWGYYHIMGWFGDPVYFRKPLDPSEYETIARTPVATVVADLYKDLDEAAAGFDASNAAPVIEYGRVNKGVALGLKARLAMLIKDYATAKAATQTIISSNAYGLNPRYTDLFMLAGQRTNTNRELMFVQTYPTDILDPQNWLCVLTIPRQVGTSQSSHFPSQQLVDLFEGRDGKRIDQSSVYSAAAPSQNRDNRLRWTVYMQGDTMVHMTAKAPSLPYVQPKERTIFNIYSNVRIKFNWNTGVYDNLASNIDWIGFLASPWFAGATGNNGGVGYVWRKYVDSTQYSWETKTGYINMRYAEILLTNAEAKIELGETDASVLSAINAVRARAGQPAVTGGSAAELRELVRRERAVEFAGEGLRLIDLRRWDLYATANSMPVVGVSLNPADPAETPTFNASGLPVYSAASIAKRLKTRVQTRVNTNAKYKLWPIPQGEIDKNKNIVQNPGWQ
ncbi:MAG: RagB/SusD family nutrient uptake outer membrane protein [Chitinophagaceae bacterium]|nr:RagB/SusD family nutrient uptake outer membrane protein [Chitinophagaceae bacterium]NCW87581.1 RagB/SusD family nutrient uptake outer membrane protein [Chitinophagia bacterium]